MYLLDRHISGIVGKLITANFRDCSIDSFYALKMIIHQESSPHSPLQSQICGVVVLWKK